MTSRASSSTDSLPKPPLLRLTRHEHARSWMFSISSEIFYGNHLTHGLFSHCGIRWFTCYIGSNKSSMNHIRKAPCLRFSLIYFTRLCTSIPLLLSNESKSRSTNLFSRLRRDLQNVSCSSNLLHTRETLLPNLQRRLSWGTRFGNTYWWETPRPTPGIQEAKTGEGEKRFSAKTKKLGEGWKCGLERGMGNIVVLGVWEVLCDVRLGFVATIRGELLGHILKWSTQNPGRVQEAEDRNQKIRRKANSKGFVKRQGRLESGVGANATFVLWGWLCVVRLGHLATILESEDTNLCW